MPDCGRQDRTLERRHRLRPSFQRSRGPGTPLARRPSGYQRHDDHGLAAAEGGLAVSRPAPGAPTGRERRPAFTNRTSLVSSSGSLLDLRRVDADEVPVAVVVGAHQAGHYAAGRRSVARTAATSAAPTVRRLLSARQDRRRPPPPAPLPRCLGQPGYNREAVVVY